MASGSRDRFRNNKRIVLYFCNGFVGFVIVIHPYVREVVDKALVAYPDLVNMALF